MAYSIKKRYLCNHITIICKNMTHMKKLRRIFAIMSIVMCWLPGFSTPESKQPSKPTNNGSAILTTVTKGQQIKRAPSKTLLELQYSEGCLTLSSYSYEETFTITATNTSTGTIYTVPSIHTGESIYLVIDNGYYEIMASSTDNRIFFGEMLVE